MATDRLTDEQLAAIAERVNKADIAPWRATEKKACIGVASLRGSVCYSAWGYDLRTAADNKLRCIANMDFVCHAPTDIQLLLAEVAALKAENADLRAKLAKASAREWGGAA